ncbi:hypothetical protein C5N14_30820 [Micromonospora sp. MW-13]|uniref:hypothetical protein n=1 Tax=Micromonospora sp. MW-13 TaxID=2094022 RepID=UPI000EDE4A2D|nr:hypothetical protein [Micromonospora sp. MW-13]RGC64986.1 hypothetical protein C5N14_30820 [Micromonospora sp. MW-13]
MDRTDVRQPTAAMLAAALFVLAKLAEDGGLMYNRWSGWSTVLLDSTEVQSRRTILQALTHLEQYDRPDHRGGRLALWRGRLAGWQLCVVQWLPVRADSPTDEPAVDTGPATAAAEMPAGPVSSWPVNAGPVPAQRPGRPSNGPSWSAEGARRALYPVAPAPLADPALTPGRGVA